MVLQHFCWLAAFSFSWSYTVRSRTQATEFVVVWSYTKYVRLFGRGSALRKASTYTQDNTTTEWMHSDIHASSGIQTHDLGVWVGEDSLALICKCGYKF
jgi:outer membrane usher protein FimD/PapC